MSTSFNIERSWFASRQTTYFPVLWCFTASSRKTCFDFLRRGAPLWGQTTGFPVLHWSGFGFGWLDWELFACRATSPSGCRATSEPNSFIQSCFKEIFGGGRGDAYTFSYMTSPVSINFRDTISWECFVKNDGVRSCLIELQSFLQSKVMSTQYTVFSCFFNVLCTYCARRGASKSIVSGSLCSLSIRPTSRKSTVCQLLKFCPPSINPELMMECKLIAHPTW